MKRTEKERMEVARASLAGTHGSDDELQAGNLMFV